MNCTVYFFGSLGKGYTQYPDDYAQEIFKDFHAKSTATSQITIHRDGSLMYYGYIRKLDVNSQYIGICILINGIMFSEIGKVFPIFENAVSDMVVRGEILHFNNQGELTSSVLNLNEKRQEIERITSVIENQVLSLEVYSRKLPPVNYATSISDSKYFQDSSRMEDIVNSSCKYGYTIVQKTHDYESAAVFSYKNILFRLNKEKNELENKCEELKSQNYALKNKQRNTLWVGVLSVIVALLGVILYFKVINPSEVTHYETKEFIYYGPIKNRLPHGVGVAIYYDDDKDGRKFYFGNFDNGIKKDSLAMLYYRNGTFFYGQIEDRSFRQGMQYMNTSNAYFVGTFDEECNPYTGTWYDYEKAYTLYNGEIKK